MRNVLFISNPGPQCGVHQFGKATAAALSKSKAFNFIYVECSDSKDQTDYLTALKEFSPVAVIYNWHQSTMRWLSEELLRNVSRLLPHLKHAAVVHDYEAPFSQLCAIIHPDPTFQEIGRHFRVGRRLPSYTPKVDTPKNVIGSFGFAVGNKNFTRIVQQVNLEFETATVRLHIPYAQYGDADGTLARKVVQGLKKLAKPGITIQATHDFMQTDELLNWLAGNTINCFFYDWAERRGISSVLDFAIAARRPIAITSSWMFRHVVGANPTILIEYANLCEIIANGTKPLEPFYQMWTEEKLVRDYERIVDSMLVMNEYNRTSNNRVLTPLDRKQLQPVVEELTRLAPEIMSRKIPGAVFQNAFLFQQVRNIAKKTDKIIVIGGFEDPIGPALRQLRYNVEITDPQIDGKDMETVWIESVKFGIEYDMAIACSVLEHVEKDVEFIQQMYQILRPGGIALLTVDYLENWTEEMPKPSVDVRLYTSERLKYLVSQLPPGCLVDPPTWDDQGSYFRYESAKYGFCSLVFRRPVLANVLDYYVPAGLGQFQNEIRRFQNELHEARIARNQLQAQFGELQNKLHEARIARNQLQARYEEQLAQLTTERERLSQQAAELQSTVQTQQQILDMIHSSLGWKLISTYRWIKEKLFPSGSIGRRVYDYVLIKIKAKVGLSTISTKQQRLKRKKVLRIFLHSLLWDIYHLIKNLIPKKARLWLIPRLARIGIHIPSLKAKLLQKLHVLKVASGTGQMELTHGVTQGQAQLVDTQEQAARVEGELTQSREQGEHLRHEIGSLRTDKGRFPRFGSALSLAIHEFGVSGLVRKAVFTFRRDGLVGLRHQYRKFVVTVVPSTIPVTQPTNSTAKISFFDNLKTSNSTPPEILMLDKNYSVDEPSWLRYLTSVYETKLIRPLRKAGTPPPQARLWIAIDTGIRFVSSQLTATVKSIGELVHASECPVTGVCVTNLIDNINSHAVASSSLPVLSMTDLSAKVDDEDLVFFVQPGDELRRELHMALKLHDCFSNSLTLVDLYYRDNGRIFPYLLPGADPIHGLEVDYFQSRFLIRGAQLKEVVFHTSNSSIRGIACDVLRRSIQDKSERIGHVGLPLVCINLETRRLIEQRMQYFRDNRNFFASCSSGSNTEIPSDITAIICTKDKSQLLAQLVNSLLRQKRILEVIVISNNTTNPYAIYELQRLGSHPAVKILRYDRPFNFSEQCNLGAKYAKGNNFLFLNDDIVVLNSNWLDGLHSWLDESRPRIIGPLLLYPDESVQHGGMFLGFNNVAGHCLRHAQLPEGDYGFLLTAPRRVSCLTGAVLLMARDTFDKLNGFDPLLPTYLQDVDLCLRAFYSGAELIFEPRVSLLHMESISVKIGLLDPKAGDGRTREYEYFRVRWAHRIAMDPYFNPLFDLQDETLRSLRI